jgi:beta-glucosidase
MTWVQPRDPSSAEDVAAAEKVMQCKLGWFANPILGNGDYPELLKERAREIARQHGYQDDSVVLPRFSPEDRKINQGIKCL